MANQHWPGDGSRGGSTTVGTSASLGYRHLRHQGSSNPSCTARPSQTTKLARPYRTTKPDQTCCCTSVTSSTAYCVVVLRGAPCLPLPRNVPFCAHIARRAMRWTTSALTIAAAAFSDAVHTYAILTNTPVPCPVSCSGWLPAVLRAGGAHGAAVGGGGGLANRGGPARVLRVAKEQRNGGHAALGQPCMRFTPQASLIMAFPGSLPTRYALRIMHVVQLGVLEVPRACTCGAPWTSSLLPAPLSTYNWSSPTCPFPRALWYVVRLGALKVFPPLDLQLPLPLPLPIPLATPCSWGPWRPSSSCRRAPPP